MMAKPRTRFVCQNCGSVYSRWSGKCDDCDAWNTLLEEYENSGVASAPGQSRNQGRPVLLTRLNEVSSETPRIITGINELDRVTGGGFVQGSVVLVGGDPGIGKSTLLMQTACQLSLQGLKIVYVSGEEAVNQVRLRACRLGISDCDVSLAAETNIENIVATLTEKTPPQLVIIDSIQTVWTNTAEAAPGTVTQVRSASYALTRYAKRTGSCMVLVGHVTKEGQIAGPKVVEHMVDGVLQFEGNRNDHFRILRTIKNRFGATDEIGVFEMTGAGLKEVINPSELFLGERDIASPGSAVFAGIEGTRPVLIEVQALVVRSSLATPRRAVVGWDNARLSMILAVLEARCNIKLGNYDVYLNIAGGYRINEPAADLAVAAALISSLSGKAISPEEIYFGEIALSGRVRPVSQTSQRIKEAIKLGFKRFVLAKSEYSELISNIVLTEIAELHEIVANMENTS